MNKHELVFIPLSLLFFFYFFIRSSFFLAFNRLNKRFNTEAEHISDTNYVLFSFRIVRLAAKRYPNTHRVRHIERELNYTRQHRIDGKRQANR